MKKNHVIILLVAIGCACLAGAFWLLHTQPHKTSDLEITRAVPLDAIYLCYFERADILNETVNNSMSGWSYLVSQEDPLLQLLRKLQVEASKNTTASELLRAKSIYSVHPQGKNEVMSLFAVALPANCTPEQLSALLKDSGRFVNIQAYHGTYITSIGAGDTILHVAAVNNIALFSQSQLLLQNAIRHINSGLSLNDNEDFKKVMQTSGAYSDVRLFVDHRKLNRLTTAMGSDKWKKYATLLPYSANWTALDGEVSPNVIHLNGFVFPSFTDDNYLSLLLSQNGAGTTAWAVLPVETAIVYNIGLSDVPGFLAGQKRFMDKHKLLSDYKKGVLALNDHLQMDSEELFLSLYVEEVAAAFIPGNHSGWVTMFKTANQKYVLEQFKNIATELKEPFAVSDKKENFVYHNPAKGLLPTLFAQLFADIDDAYFILQDNWIIFGNSQELLTSLKEGKGSLKKYMQSTQANQYISSNSVFSLFIQPEASNKELLSYFNTSFQKEITKALQGDAYKIAGLQMRPSGDKLYTTLFSIYDSEEKALPKAPEQASSSATVVPEQTTSAATVTQSAEATTTKVVEQGKIVRKYAITTNNKGGDFLLQYDNKTIAFVDKNGAEQWAQRIDEVILDTVYQIDFYKNGKRQMLFVTGNKMYLIDRSGQTVAPFPLSLSPAANYLAVFDYDKNRDYRLFTVQGNNVVRAYDKKGRAVDGWKPFTAKSTITRAPEFFRVAGKDYIVVCGEQSTYFLDRKGNERLTLSSAVIIKSGTPILVQQQSPALKVTTTSGKTVTINLKDGKVN